MNTGRTRTRRGLLLLAALALLASCSSGSSDSDDVGQGGEEASDEQIEAALEAGDASIPGAGPVVDLEAIEPVTIEEASAVAGEEGAAVEDVGAEGYFYLELADDEGASQCLDDGQAELEFDPGAESASEQERVAYLTVCQETDGQQWRFVEAGDGLYQLQTVRSQGEDACLEVSSAEAGATAGMEACGDAPEQLWSFVEDGAYALQSSAVDGMCLDLALEGGAGLAECEGPTFGRVSGSQPFGPMAQVAGRTNRVNIIPAGCTRTFNPSNGSFTMTCPAGGTTSAPPTTTTATAAPPTSSAAGASGSGCDADMAAVLEETERQRNAAEQEDGLDRPNLTWDSAIACEAQRYAQQKARAWANEPSPLGLTVEDHDNGGSATWQNRTAVTEGMAAGPGTTAADGLRQWETSERRYFDFSASEELKRKDHTCKPGGGVCGHYGATINAGFWTRIGCGSAVTSGRAGDQRHLITVCRFGP